MNQEKERIDEVYLYDQLDNLEEKQLDNIIQLASIICDTPIALISMLDDKEQWFKARKGLNVEKTTRQDAFCQYTIAAPDEVLIIEDTLKDERFVKNPMVVDSPKVRSYLGAPLKTKKGLVLGTICVKDTKPRNFSNKQIAALQYLSKIIIDYFDGKKLVAIQQKEIKRKIIQLQKITDQAPGVIYQAVKKKNEKTHFEFISDGISRLHPSLTKELVMSNMSEMNNVIHPEDLKSVERKISESYYNLNPFRVEYRVVLPNNTIRWWFAKSNPEKIDANTVAWYGTIQDITARKEYENAMEQISFDISHVMRKPVSNLLGLVDIFKNEKEITKNEMDEYVYYIQSVSSELDEFTKQLNETYHNKKTDIKNSNVFD